MYVYVCIRMYTYVYVCIYVYMKMCIYVMFDMPCLGLEDVLKMFCHWRSQPFLVEVSQGGSYSASSHSTLGKAHKRADLLGGLKSTGHLGVSVVMGVPLSWMVFD